MDVVLEAGDLLYFPRGTIHQVSPASQTNPPPPLQKGRGSGNMSILSSSEEDPSSLPKNGLSIKGRVGTRLLLRSHLVFGIYTVVDQLLSSFRLLHSLTPTHCTLLCQPTRRTLGEICLKRYAFVSQHVTTQVETHVRETSM